MRKTLTAVVYTFALMSMVLPASAQSRNAMGWLSLVAGSVLVTFAYDKTEVCPDRYTKEEFITLVQRGWCSDRPCYGHTSYEHTSKSVCYYFNPDRPGDADVKDTIVNRTLHRRKLAWSGVGAIGLGIVLIALPENRVTRDLDMQVSRKSVSVGRTFGW